jgi:hypothetical protein
MILGPMKWYVVAETLRQALDADLSVPVQRSGVVPGSIAWDECDCGLLAVTAYQVYPTEVFPTLLTEVSGGCDASQEAAEIVIQVVRCAPQPGEQSQSPSVAALDASAQEVLRDAFEMITSVRGTLCQMQNDRDILDFILRPLVSVGPNGACVGNELRVVVGLLRG